MAPSHGKKSSRILQETFLSGRVATRPAYLWGPPSRANVRWLHNRSAMAPASRVALETYTTRPGPVKPSISCIEFKKMVHA
jgi:hypothetical protein